MSTLSLSGRTHAISRSDSSQINNGPIRLRIADYWLHTGPLVSGRPPLLSLHSVQSEGAGETLTSARPKLRTGRQWRILSGLC